MRALLLVIAVVAVLAVAALVFFSMGGFERIDAMRIVSQRGFAATEPVAAPGFRQLKLPKGWVRDAYPEVIEDGVAQRPRSPGPRPKLVMYSDEAARVHFVLGRYGDTAGTASAARLTASLRPLEAGPWPEPENPPEKGLLAYDAARRVRWDLDTTPDIYSRDQGLALLRSVAASAELDEAALAAAAKERRGQTAGKREAIAESRAWIARHFQIPEPLTDGLHAVKERTFLWVSPEAVQAYVYVGESPANPKRLSSNEKELFALSSPRPGEIVLFSLELGQEIGEHRTDTPLPAAVQKALPKDAVAVYRYASLPFEDGAEIRKWFELSAELRKRHAAGSSVWGTRAESSRTP